MLSAYDNSMSDPPKLQKADTVNFCYAPPQIADIILLSTTSQGAGTALHHVEDLL